MTGTRDVSMEGQIKSKMHELVTCMCVVRSNEEGECRGMIEGIESLVLGKDFPETFERSQFKVHLISGDKVIVSGSAIFEIESTTALRSRVAKKPGMKARKARTNKMVAERRKSIATKASKTAARAMTRRAKERKTARVPRKKARKATTRRGNR